MLERTGTEWAPWHLVEGDSKRFARVKVIETVIAAAEDGPRAPRPARAAGRRLASRPCPCGAALRACRCARPFARAFALAWRSCLCRAAACRRGPRRSSRSSGGRLRRASREIQNADRRRTRPAAPPPMSTASLRPTSSLRRGVVVVRRRPSGPACGRRQAGRRTGCRPGRARRGGREQERGRAMRIGEADAHDARARYYAERERRSAPSGCPRSAAPQVAQPHDDQPGEAAPHAARCPSPGRARAARPARRPRRPTSIPHIRKRVSPAPMRIPSSANTAPLAGIISAKSHQISCACAITAVVARERARDDVAEREQHERRTAAPTTTDQPIIRSDAARAPGRVAARRACRPTITCAAIASASSTSARNTNSWNAIWCAPSDGRADAREHGRGDEERAEQRGRAHRDLDADPHQRPDPRPAAGAASRRAAGPRRTRAPMPACAITVPHAEPARPQSKP